MSIMFRSTPASFCLAFLSLLISATYAYPSVFPDCPKDGAPMPVFEELPQEVNNDDVDAPSPSPSMFAPCSSQISNARGSYTTTRAPCTFDFHNATDNETDATTIQYRTSDLCSPENSFLTIKDYVDDWADECVGDFARCYSVEYHQSVLFEYVCSKGWNIPNGTTHISVDCRDDKDLVLESVSRIEMEQSTIKRQQVQEQVTSQLLNVVLGMSCFVVAVFAVSKWIIKPLVSLREPTCRHGSCSCRGGQSCRYHETLCLTRESTMASDLTLDSTAQEQDDRDEGNNEDEEFHMQMPADFDAVPIVPATAAPSVPEVAVQATLAVDSDPLSETTAPTLDYDGVPLAAATVIPEYL